MERAEELIVRYGLFPHPEGGAYREVYAAEAQTEGRALSGSIYYLLRGGERSRLHRIDCEEVWYFHEGCGMLLTVLLPDGCVRRERLGGDASDGQRFMVAVPAHAVFAAENLNPEGYTFVSCMTSPRFRYEGFELVKRAELERICPAHADSLSYLAFDG